jgi:hypothetical protein
VRHDFEGKKNNVAEYEGLLLGVRKGRGIGARRVVINTYSELITRHIGKTYKAKYDILTKPLDQATFAHLRGELQLFFLFELRLGGLMYICMLHFHLCFISCLHLCIIVCICNVCYRDVLLLYALFTMIC